MQDNKGFPWLLSSNPPRPIASASVPGVEYEDENHIGGREDDWNLGLQ